MVYKKVFESQFNSQKSLMELLDGKTYQSLKQKPVGETITGAQAFGFWHISFVQDTFTWEYQDVSEAGTYQYLDNDNFTVVLPGRQFSVAVEGDDIVFDGVRYRGSWPGLFMKRAILSPNPFPVADLGGPRRQGAKYGLYFRRGRPA